MPVSAAAGSPTGAPALGAFTAFEDVAYGLIGPITGLFTAAFGHPSVFVVGASGAPSALSGGHAAAATERAPRATQVAVASDPYVDLKLAIKQQRIEFDPNIDGLRDAGSEIARLKKVAYSPTTLGADASQALYRIAVLLHKPLKQNSEALRTLDVYRRRFAGGSEMHAAEWLRVRIACERAIDDECREAAYTYQHEVPVGSAADVAIRITNAQ